MKTRQCATILLLCTAWIGFACLAGGAQAQATTRQLRSLMPDETDLQGFTHRRPAGVNPPRYGIVSADAVIPDQVWPGIVRSQTATSGVLRALWSNDGLYMLEIRLKVCGTSQAAREELDSYLQQSSGVFRKGKFTGAESIGDECWVLPANIYGSTLIFRAGKIFVVVSGRQSPGSNRNGEPSITFPPEAVEAVAYQILLRASQKVAITSVPTQAAQLTVNDHALPKNSLMVGRQTYVSVKAFAKAMGLTSGWDAKTGALTLSGAKRKTVALTAGSTQATVGGAKAAALTVPVLKDGGEPVMALSDLLTLTGGRITGHAGNTVQVKG